jgi:hypothetical protein
MVQLCLTPHSCLLSPTCTVHSCKRTIHSTPRNPNHEDSNAHAHASVVGPTNTTLAFPLFQARSTATNGSSLFSAPPSRRASPSPSFDTYSTSHSTTATDIPFRRPARALSASPCARSGNGSSHLSLPGVLCSGGESEPARIQLSRGGSNNRLLTRLFTVESSETPIVPPEPSPRKKLRTESTDDDGLLDSTTTKGRGSDKVAARAGRVGRSGNLVRRPKSVSLG